MNLTKKIKVAVYLRVSTDEQAKKFGLDTQLRKIKSYIKYHEDEGWIFDENLVYRDEGLSGTLPPEARPALSKLMEDAKKGKFTFVLVYKLDRFFRSMRLLLETIENLQALNVGFVSVSEKFDTTPLGKLLMNIFGTLAQFERDLIIERTTEGKISASKAGNYVGGSIPLGYKAIGKKIIINAKEAQIVRDIFYWFVEEDHSCLSIARLLTQRKVLTNRDKKYGGRYRKTNSIAFWNETTIRKRLQDEHYIGNYYYNKRDSSGKLKPQDQWVEMTCPQIIDNETFIRAQEKIEVSKKLANNKKYDYLFSTKVFCGECGSSCTSYMSAKKTKNYRCLKKNKSKVERACKGCSISEAILDQLIWPQISKLLKSPVKTLKEMDDSLKVNSKKAFYVRQKKLLEAELEKLKLARSRIIDLYSIGEITKEEFEEKAKALEYQKEEIQEQLNAINSFLGSSELKKEKIESIKELFSKYKKNFKNLSYKERMALIQVLVKRIVLNGQDINLELIVPRKELKNSESAANNIPTELSKLPQKNIYGKVQQEYLYGGTGGI